MGRLKYKSDQLKCWDDFHIKAQEMHKNSSEKKWIFRGHTAPRKSLKSSLERAVEYYPEHLQKKNKAEDRLLREFKRRYHQYSSDAPENSDYLEWFSIMQHYGAPTRLLDFTYSIYVAAYFALEHTGEGPFEIFAVDLNWAIRESLKNIKRKASEKIYLNSNNFLPELIENTEEHRQAFKDIFIKNTSINFVCPINPFRLTERISLQNGVFMCPGNVDAAFEENLESMKGWDKKDNFRILSLNFDKNKEEISVARGHLYNLNITCATLFPGLAGFAKSLVNYPPKNLHRPYQKSGGQMQECNDPGGNGRAAAFRDH